MTELECSTLLRRTGDPNYRTTGWPKKYDQKIVLNRIKASE